MQEYLTTEELAAELRTTPETVRYWHKVGKGPQSFKVGRRRLYSRASVNVFVEAAMAAEGTRAAS